VLGKPKAKHRLCTAVRDIPLLLSSQNSGQALANSSS